MSPITVHMIGNAHIDPVWLWRFQAGITEVLSTCHTAVSLLRSFPDFIFTRADAWVYEQVERYDPELFADVTTLIKEKRWHVTGGWYVQPDCNFPSAASFQKHMSIGNAYFKDRFGITVAVGFNVDSFGHTGYLPRLLKAEGFDSYIFMRPMAHEMELPANLFRWRSPDGSEVTAFRIQRSYNASNPAELQKNVDAAIIAALPDIPHVLCFYGVGDHGGGPTAEVIEWIIDHMAKIPGATLKFSTPADFFKDVRGCPGYPTLPVVEGELQFHAIGCYSAAATFKRSLRRAEKSIIEAEAFSATFAGSGESANNTKLTEAWRLLLFNQFHDTLGGSSIPEAYADVAAQTGMIQTVADGIINDICFQQLVGLGHADLQRIIVANPFDFRFVGPLFHEPWINWQPFTGTLIGEDGNSIRHQVIQQSSLTHNSRKVVWIADLKPRSITEYRLNPSSEASANITPTNSAKVLSDPRKTISNGIVTVSAGQDKSLFTIDSERISVGIEVVEDLSDTWSHGISSYDGRSCGFFRPTDWDNDDTGPVLTSLRIGSLYGRSTATTWINVYADYPVVDLYMRIHWFEEFCVAKLRASFESPPLNRIDGVPGGERRMPLSNREYPFQDWTHFTFIGENAHHGISSLAIISPDCFSLSGTDSSVGITLFRSPPFAWHDPYSLKDGYPYHFMDQGEHVIRVRFLLDADIAELDAHAACMHSPFRSFDWTRSLRRKEG